MLTLRGIVDMIQERDRKSELPYILRVAITTEDKFLVLLENLLFEEGFAMVPLNPFGVASKDFLIERRLRC